MQFKSIKALYCFQDIKIDIGYSTSLSYYFKQDKKNRLIEIHTHTTQQALDSCILTNFGNDDFDVRDHFQGPGQRARSHSAARGWLAWPRTERDERRGQIQRRRRSYSRRAARPTAAACGRPRRRPAPRWIPWAPARGMAAAAWRTELAAAPSHIGRPQIRINSAPF